MEDPKPKAANDPKLDPMLEWAERLTSPIAWLSILITIIFVLVVWNVASAAEILVGRVVGVSDGDSITVLDTTNRQHKIRVAGIDAPEDKQAFGYRSKQHLSDLVFDKWVTIEYNKHDRYGRIVGKVWVAPNDACPTAAPDCPRTLDVGLYQIKAGFAWHYKEYAKEQYAVDRSIYAESEERARALDFGLWFGPRPIPPWEYRKLQRPKLGQ